ncbi:MAG: alpha/beta fold hydrolase [Xanthobacteraceae bacterium]
MTALGAPPVSTYVSAPDGLSLHVAEYGRRTDPLAPIVCLPGLTRTAADFDVLARSLAHDGRRVLALESRGRGGSDSDRNTDNYSLPVELADLLAMLTACEAQPAIFIGSSRGGLLTMLLAAANPTAIRGAVFNDIGPVIEHRGLMRIKGYVGKAPTPRNFEEGGEILRRLFSQQFPALTQDDWIAWARRSWREEKKRFVQTYDARIANTLSTINPETPPPALWPQFDALKQIPLMVVRGANSDILSAETVTAMAARRSDMEVVEVADQGHTPLLDDDATIARIATFIGTCDTRAARH